MRELKKEELALVHGGSASISRLPLNWSVENSPAVANTEAMFSLEFRALNELQVHTLLDQISSDS